jgi:hypothetical protein
MSKKEYFWNYLLQKNPRLLEDPHFTTASIKKFFDIVYSKGHDDGYVAASEMQKSTYSSSSTSIFEEIFGIKK